MFPSDHRTPLRTVAPLLVVRELDRISGAGDWEVNREWLSKQDEISELLDAKVGLSGYRFSYPRVGLSGRPVSASGIVLAGRFIDKHSVHMVQDANIVIQI